MKLSTREITFTALFVALAIVAALITRSLSFMVVPPNFVPFIAILAGAVLGKRLGAYALGVYIFIGLIGIPVFSGNPPHGGLTYVLQPTFGFIIGFMVAAFVTGLIIGKSRSIIRYVTAAIAGIIVVYIVGLPYLWAMINFYIGNAVDLNWVLANGFLPFILKDIILAVLAAFIAIAVTKRLPATSLAGK